MKKFLKYFQQIFLDSWKKYGRRIVLSFVVILVVGTLGYFLIWKLPQIQVDEAGWLPKKEKVELENEIRRTWAGVAGGVTIFLTLVVGWWRAEAARKNSEAAIRTAEAMEAGQITERFTRAIDQLGSMNNQGEPNIEVRLGGIYALGQIAWDASDKFHWVVMEVLTAYLRKNSPADMSKPETPEKTIKNVIDPFMRVDFQAVISVIGRRSFKADKGHLELALTNLSSANMELANLMNASLTYANLEGSFLGLANLKNAYLYKAILTRANLNGADLRGANLKEADLRGANFNEADLRGANLEGAFRPENDIPGWDADSNGKLSRVAGTEPTKDEE